MLAVTQLAAMRGERTLFSAIDFALAPGEILEVTGANGCGKTTLLRVLCGLLAPSAGRVQWNAQDIRMLREDYHRDVAYVGHLNGIKDDFTPLENLRFARELRGERAATAAAAALSALGLTKQQQHLPSKVLSQGQKRRVALARSLFGEAKLWILDEPFAALDADALAWVTQRIGAHASNGGLTVLSSHQEVQFAAARCRRLRLGKGTPA